MHPNREQPRIQMPGQITIDIEGQPGVWASPVVVPLNVPGGAKVLAAGGLTKEEAIAAHLFAQCLEGMPPEELADRACRLAAARTCLEFAGDLLEASLEMRKAKTEESGKSAPPAEQQEAAQPPRMGSPILVP